MDTDVRRQPLYDLLKLELYLRSSILRRSVLMIRH